MREGDDDAKSLYDHKALKDRFKANPKKLDEKAVQVLAKGNPIAELQADLRAIGYPVGNENGKFGNATMKAVQRFQMHFFPTSRPHVGGANGLVDRATAEMIKKVRP